MFLGKDIREFADNKAAIYQDGTSLTYQQLSDHSELINESIIGKRGLVFCLCTNRLESLIGYVSFIIGNSVPVLLDRSLASDKLEELIEKYSPRYLWAPDDLTLSSSFKVIKEVGSYHLLEKDVSPVNDISSELKLLLTTSGSTGSSKFVRLSLQNLEANARSIAEYLSIQKNERPITVLPMHYSYGLSIINSHLIKGATLLMTDYSIMERPFWEMLSKNKASSFSGVPYTYQILKRLKIFNKDISTVKTFTQAGGKLSNSLIEEFSSFCKENGKKFFVMYGQTEATARMTYLPSELLPDKLGSVGIPIPGGHIEIMDENGEISKVGETGELVYYGNNVSLGYANNKFDLASNDQNQGKLITGDLARRDENGCIYIVGRKNRFLKIFGNRINLDEVESIVKKITPESACSGLDDQLFVFITDKSKELLIKKFLMEKVKLNRSAVTVKVINEIPKNSSGKTLYSSLKQLIK